MADAIHGSIELSPIEEAVIDTATFQRLRNLKQLGLAHVTYPNATHSRFAHSLGVFAVMSRVLRKSAHDLKISDESAQDLRLAALLHDVGHYPYSHLMERVDDVALAEEFIDESPAQPTTVGNPDRYLTHEDLGRRIVTSQADLRVALGGKPRADRIASLFTQSQVTDFQVSKLIHSSLDMDRLDYLLRDSRAAGVPYGQVDLDYILNHLRVSPSGLLGIEEKAMAAAEQYLLARYFMQRTVYYHKTTFGMEEAFRQLLRRCRDAGRHGVPANGAAILAIVNNRASLLDFTDSYLDRIARSALDDPDRAIRLLAETIVFRRPPKLLRQITVLIDDAQPEARLHNACTTFKRQCRANLSALAKKHGTLLGLFIFAEPPPIRLEKRGGLMTSATAQDQPAEDADELIKVFVGANAEPKSLVDIPHSIMHKCGGQTLRMARLYVIEGDENKVTRMRDETCAW